MIVDARLAEKKSLVFEAGSHDESIRIETGELIRGRRQRRSPTSAAE